LVRLFVIIPCLITLLLLIPLAFILILRIIRNELMPLVITASAEARDYLLQEANVATIHLLVITAVVLLGLVRVGLAWLGLGWVG